LYWVLLLPDKIIPCTKVHDAQSLTRAFLPPRWTGTLRAIIRLS
jgi:hypothetical protein